MRTRSRGTDNSAPSQLLMSMPIRTSAVADRFCAGLDLDVILGKSGEEVREFLHALYTDLYDAQYDLGKPSIAAVGGAARGGGVTMAISCDVLVASENATFGYPEVDVGVIPAIHFAHLPRIIGRHRARPPSSASSAASFRPARRMRPPWHWPGPSPASRRR